jgi:hypothetical protein
MKIICDTREKRPWDFIFYPDVEVQSTALKVGDYTTPMLKEILVIDRKATPFELAVNLGQKDDKQRFYKELEKINGYKHGYIICEFPESEVYKFPNNAGVLPVVKKKIRLTGQGLRKLISIAEEKFGVPFIFCDNKVEAEELAYGIMLDLEKRYA